MQEIVLELKKHLLYLLCPDDLRQGLQCVIVS